MKLNPYLSFDGRCEEAFRFYQSCLGGEIAALMKWGGTPAATQTPPEWHDKIIHARLVAGDLVLMGADAPPGQYKPASGISNLLSTETPAEAERVFAALGQGGTTGMPISETFFAQRFGMLTDRFGIPWMVICEQPRS
jgi:PhnB protein